MKGVSSEKDYYPEKEPEYCFWESQLYLKVKSCRFFKDNLFKYLDHGFNFYAFFTWARRWINLVAKQYVEPYKFYPLPISDQILYWQPIFARHVSDALVRLDTYETSKSKSINKPKKPYKSILMRALFLTYWKRILFIILGFVVLLTCNILLAFIFREILDNSTGQIPRLKYVLLLSTSLAFLQFLIALLLDHMNFYMYRLIHVIQYSFSITIFQHGMCHRRKFANNIEGSNSLNVCNEVLHSCSPDSECSKNPLFCQALRYQNKDINSRIFSFEFMDSYYISLFIESTIQIVQFICTFTFGFFVVTKILPIHVWPLYAFYTSVSLLMIVLEIFNTVILKYIYGLKDYRINKSREIIAGLHLINKMFMDDIAHNIITKTRNNELILLLIRFVLSFINRLLVALTISFSLTYLLDDYINNVLNTDDISGFKSGHVMSSLLIIIKSADSMLFVPDSIKFLTYSLISYFRVEYYMNECSPNFYISDNKYTGSVKTSTNIVPITTQLPKDVVVYYKDATFTWVNTRNDLLNKNYDTYLKNINFELKRGEMVIVTGSQGSGKSNFIKSMLGEMTLVGGSMAVVPLHTSMPIFYASQDIFLQQGTIRSNIVFGHRFDEYLYNTVLKAVELEFDISTWDKGDLRVVSDNAHSLSGGQRVRMELARAVYAYLIFHQVNTEYNNSQCSFLMCLDASFHGLDPYVSKTIFNNLFNLKTGLLIKNDLSVVLTSIKRDLKSISINDVSYPNMPLYNITDKTLKKIKDMKYSQINASPTTTVLKTIEPEEMMKMCDSGENSRSGRKKFVIEKYEDSLIINPESKVTVIKLKESFKSYIIYLKSIGPLFALFVIFTFTYIAIENFTYVKAGGMGDLIMEIVVHVKSEIEAVSSYSTIIAMCNRTLTKIKIMTLFIVIFCFLANSVLTFCCLRGCKRIHEYCINSLINNNSTVVRIKQYSSEILTFLSSDVFMIDENFGPCLSSLLILFIGVVVQAMVIVYSHPICIPVVFLSLFVIINFVFKRFVHASKNLQIASLESLSRNNFVCQNAVSSSSTYRSFKKESTLLDNVIEYTDYCIRSWFYSKSFLSWASFVSKFVFLGMMLFTFLAPVLYKKYVGMESFVGFQGLNVMQNTRIIFTFTNFVVAIAKLEMLMCSIKRFECFIPPGQKCVFQKYRNVHKEDPVVNIKLEKILSINDVKDALILRRKKEFKEENKKFYCFRRLGFRPRINIISPNLHLNQEHSGVELKNVCVYTTTDLNPEGMILKNITVSAHKAEIIGIVGRTGAGKTTLLSVLQNISTNRTGQVLLDGKDLNDIPKVVLRQIIGVLPQLPFVFKGWTIRRFLDPRKLFSDDEINDALDQSGLLNFVNELPGSKKLDSVIIPDNLSSYMPNDKNDMELNTENLKDYYEQCDMLLSNTQLRTLSFARLVLYRNLFRIILVDEPPSENCYENEYSESDTGTYDLGVPIYELLKKFFQHCTTFVTAHDSNALRMCNSVWILHQGMFMGKCGVDEILKENSIANIIQKFVK
ncbi:uncharacterized protein TOT_020000970 [Theileria orientalis strain Shintoku]|uniref:ABC transporter n=1 Tax=Theileria orientalis strain Shintoku TaxID=869250 RepID=J4D8D1_THEOR|nr:uncharacterized protein TOT_020000970 [Theileria orientalis strain Shintoku]BAM40715.1 uncharacterized protein TOT_020000970 [Theileria orientalis strain Shintoku]|eukprot:XP_009691016.1 uncharacterized protein TOT_020000970 [Theileria orientalis strain Shintoku]